MMQNRIIETKLIKWRNIKPLQPDNLKIVYNYKHIEESILKNGFSMPFFVWKNGKDIFAIDGHSRIEVLSNMENVPEELPATFVDAKNKKEAIEILLEVFNQKQNPIAEEVLAEWVEVEELEVNVDALNVKNEDIYIQNDSLEIGGNDEKIEKEFGGILLPLILNIKNQTKIKFKNIQKNFNNDDILLNKLIDIYNDNII